LNNVYQYLSTSAKLQNEREASSDLGLGKRHDSV